MRRTLKADHKLKHWGRLQYGLFLKGIGLSLEDALAMWRSEFTKVMSDKDFEVMTNTNHFSNSLIHCFFFCCEISRVMRTTFVICMAKLANEPTIRRTVA